MALVAGRGDHTGGRGLATAVVIGVTALAVQLAGVWRPAWSRDEAATVLVVRRPLVQAWRSWLTDPALEPYYLLMNAWASVSTTGWWLRLPSALAAAATAALLVLLITRLLSPTAGVLAGVFFAVIPAVSRYGQEARPYALTMLAVTALMWWWTTDRTVPGWRRVLLAAGLVVIGLLHAYALLVLLVLAVTTMLRPAVDRGRELRGLLVAGALAGLVLSPYLWLLVGRAKGDPNPAPATIDGMAIELLRLPPGVLRPTGAAVVGILVLLLALIGLIVGWRRGGAARLLVLHGGSWLAVWLAGLTALQLLSSAPGLVTRYFTPALPALALLAAPLLESLWRRARAAAVATLVAVALTGLPTQLAIRTPDGHVGQGWRALPALMAGEDLADAAVLVKGSTTRTLLANGMPLARMPLVKDPAADGRVVALTSSSRSDVARLAEQHAAVVVIPNAELAIDRPPTADAFTDFRRELRPFPRAVVLCHYFDDPLGVFLRAGVTPDPGWADRVAAALTRVDGNQVGCTVSDGA